VGEFAIRASLLEMSSELLEELFFLPALFFPELLFQLELLLDFVPEESLLLEPPELLLELLPLFLLNEEPEEPPELWFEPKAFLQLDSISLKFQY